MQEIEQLYSKYFCMPDNIDNVYHRKYTINGQYMAPKIPMTPDMSQTEMVIRHAMGMSKNGEIYFDATNVPVNAIESVLLNIPKIKDENLKKRILHYFRLYGNEINRLIHSHGDIILNAVANVAISQKIATSHDYACCVRNTRTGTEKSRILINDLINQAKIDIKIEKEQNIPDAHQIKKICDNVITCTYFLPAKTREILSKEFDFNEILRGGDYIGNFEKTIEIEHADAAELQEKIEAFSGIIGDYDDTKSANEDLRNQVKKLQEEKSALEQKLQLYREIALDYNNMLNTWDGLVAENFQLSKENKQLTAANTSMEKGHKDLLKENTQIKAENEKLKTTLANLHKMAKKMAASLFSRGVNRYKAYVRGVFDGLEK
jgi:cell division protein FtsB